MAVTTQAPKLQYSSLEEYQKKLANSTSPTSQSTSYFQRVASGAPSSATSAAIAGNREAMARAASNVRAAAASQIVKGGGLGQGEAVKGTQEAEQGVLRSLADSRNKELEVLGKEQASANETVLNQSNTERNNTLAAIQAGVAAGGSLKAGALKGLGTYLDSIGVQQATDESAAAYDQYLADEMRNDPSAQTAKLTAEQTLKAEQAKAAMTASTGTAGGKIVAAFSTSPNVAYNAFIAGLPNPKQQDGDYWDRVVLPKLQAGDAKAAETAINAYPQIRQTLETVSQMPGGVGARAANQMQSLMEARR